MGPGALSLLKGVPTWMLPNPEEMFLSYTGCQ